MSRWRAAPQRNFWRLFQRWNNARALLKAAPQWLLLLILFAPNPCGAFEVCTPAYQPPANPFIAEVNQCLYTVIAAINRSETGDYPELGARLVRAILENKAWGNKGPSDPINIERLMEVVAILNAPALIELALERFVNSPLGDGEEASIAFARLYAWKAPDVVRAIDRQQGENRKNLIATLSWGIANLYWGHINKSNYRRMAIGVHWELLEKKYPLRSTVSEIEKAVLDIVSR